MEQQNNEQNENNYGKPGFTTASDNYNAATEKLANNNPAGNPFPEQISASDGSTSEAVHGKALMSAEDIDKHIAEAKPAIQAAILPHLPNPKIAVIYQVVRPILEVVVGVLFFHPAWAKGIKAFIAVMDAEFPSATN